MSDPIADGHTVSLHYTGTIADGTVFDSSDGREPLSFTVGKGQVIPGFEKAVRGMRAGEKKTFTVAKEDAYPYREEMVLVMPRDQAPAGMELTEGMTLALRGPNGEVVPGRVTNLTDKGITIDLNPPVAGKDLTFTIEIVTVA